MIAFNSDRTDEELFERFRDDGCQESFGELVSRYHWLLVGYLRRREIFTGDEEDLVQATWLKIILKCGQFQIRFCFRSFLFGFLKNVVRANRKQSRNQIRLNAKLWEEQRFELKASWFRRPAESGVIKPAQQRRHDLLSKGVAQGQNYRVELFQRYYCGKETQAEIELAEGLKPGELHRILQTEKKRLQGIIESDGAFLKTWTPETIALLGKMRDRELAELLGVNEKAVQTKRTRLKIPPFDNRRTRRGWTEIELGLLGKLPDTEIAEQLKINPATVRRERIRQGIPASC